MTEFICSELSYKVMGVLYKIHNKLGTGLLEKHYSKAIEIELIDQKIPFTKEQMIQLEYNGKNIGKFFVDYVINDQIVIEIKATRLFNESSFRQAYSYLRQLNLPLAIVCNFHGDNLRYKRIINSHYQPPT